MRSRATLDKVLAGVLAGLLLLRFAAIAMDAPGGIVSHSGAFITDEGYYLKAARLYHTAGAWRSAAGPDAYVYTVVYAALTTVLGYLPWPLLFVGRYLSVVSSIGAIAVFYGICRRGATRPLALVCCIMVAASLDNVTYSRLALAEPLGTLFGLLAVFCWVSWCGRWGRAVLSLLFAVLAVFTKVSLVYTLAAVLLLWFVQAAAAYRGGKRRVAAGLLALAVGAAALAAGGSVLLARAAAENTRELETGVRQQFAVRSVGAALSNQWGLLVAHAKQPWRLALVAATLLGLALWLARRPWRTPSGAAAGDDAASGESWRPVAGLLVWGGLGMLLLGSVEYRVPRWLYFSAFPLAFLPVVFLRRALPRGHWRVTVASLVAVHALLQCPSVYRYLARQDKWSLVNAARDVARRVEAGGAPVAVVGNFSVNVSLFGAPIRPLISAHNTQAELRERVRRWRPRYFAGYSVELSPLRACCSDLIRAFEPVASYAIMENYYCDEDLRLMRLVYREGDPGASAP